MNQNSIKLGVNIDHAGTLRQARYRNFSDEMFVEPKPREIGMLVENAGADSITMHLREDRRHMLDADMFEVKKVISIPMNFEMACTEEMIDFALKLQPKYACIVPEKREEVTTEGGLDVLNGGEQLKRCVKILESEGIEVSLFIDADRRQILEAKKLGATAIELHTGSFATKYYEGRRSFELEKLVKGAEFGHEIGLLVNAGHGINYVNIKDILEIPFLNELNIGHSIISRALIVGIERAVMEMKNFLRS